MAEFLLFRGDRENPLRYRRGEIFKCLPDGLVPDIAPDSVLMLLKVPTLDFNGADRDADWDRDRRWLFNGIIYRRRHWVDVPSLPNSARLALAGANKTATVTRLQFLGALQSFNATLVED